MTKFCITKLNKLFLSGAANIPYYVEGEYIWSYLNRLSRANGCENIHEFLSIVLNKKKITGDDITTLLELVHVDSKQMIHESCSITAISIFLPDPILNNLISTYFYDGKLNHYNRDFIKQRALVKVCPLCLKDDEHAGIRFLHTIHQLPGIHVCPYHNVALEYVAQSDCSEPIENVIRLEALEYKTSLFMTRLHESGFSCSRSATVKAIQEILKERYTCTTKREIIANLMKDKELVAFSQNRRLILDTLNDNSRSFIDLDFVASFIAVIFDTADKFIATVSKHIEIESQIFERMASSTFELVGDYTYGVITLRCCNCGKQFLCTAWSVFHGNKCPHCCSQVNIRNDAEYVAARQKAILALIKDKPNRKIDSIENGVLTIIDTRLANVYQVDAIQYLETYELPTIHNKAVENKNLKSDYLRIENLVLYPLGIREGVPICDSLLSYLGIIESAISSTVALFGNKYINERHLSYIEGITVNVITVRGKVTESDWLLKAFLATLHFYSYTTTWTKEVALSLACKMKQLGVSIKTLATNDISLFESDCKEAADLLGRV